MFNNEYYYWKEFFSQKENQKKITYLKKKYKDKKIILYSNGIYFDALVDSYRLKKILNIVGISDIRYEDNKQDIYKGYCCIRPSDLKNIKFDLILVTSPNPESIKKYLKENLNIKSKIEAFDIKDFNIFENSFLKFELAYNYLIESKNLFKTAKYTLFCTNRELNTKTNYLKVLKKLKQKEKLRVLFICEENSKWGYQSLYEELKKDNRFEILPVVIYPIITKSRIEFNQGENISFFEKLGIKAVDGYDYKNSQCLDIKTFEPDLVFYQQPWYIQGNNHPYKVSEYALTMMIPYGFTTLNENSWGSDSVKRVYSSLWKFFSESKYHNKFYEKAANMRRKDILVATGTPKLDSYFLETNPKIEKLWKGENAKYRIIWAPHHSINNEGLRMSTFQENYEYFLNFAKRYSQFSFILKPHPALRNMCIKSCLMNEKEYDNYIKEWQSLENANVYIGGNYFDIFKSSDILITDCSSFLAEYFPSRKPIIFLDRKDRAPFDKFGNKLKKGFYRVENYREIEPLIKTVLLEKKDTLKVLRAKIITKNFGEQKVIAASKIIQILNKELF